MHGPVGIYGAVGFCWSGGRHLGEAVPSQYVLGVFGGPDWTIVGANVVGGQAYGQMPVGLDISNPDPGLRIPMRWTLNEVHATGNGAAAAHPLQNHSLYVLSTPQVAMGAAVSQCRFGPCADGSPVVKVGGTGGQPLTGGACGIAAD